MVSVEYHTYLCLSLFKVIIIPSTACLQGMLLALHSYIYKQNEFRNSYFNIIFGTMKTEWNGIKLALGFFYLISFAYDAPEERLLVGREGVGCRVRERKVESCVLVIISSNLKSCWCCCFWVAREQLISPDFHLVDFALHCPFLSSCLYLPFSLSRSPSFCCLGLSIKSQTQQSL